MAKLRYFRQFHKPLDLRSPQTINEKILWLSLFSDTTEWTRLADKYAVRSYVEEKGLYGILPELYGVWDSAEKIDWARLPESFVMKANNGSGTVKVVMDKSELDIAKEVGLLDKWLRIIPGQTTTEFHYQRIKPCLVAEELLRNPDSVKPYSSTLIDYKVWCFNGKARYIWTCCSRIGERTHVAMFDTEWNYHPEMSVFTDHYQRQDPLTPRPENLEEMLSIAETLSGGMPVVRVDLYNLEGKVYFGELTFTSLGGQMDFYTDEALLSMGRMIDISNVEKVR